ncbi:AraC family transcriptional regulator [uncultured Aquimarina sp.]|uniref:helix-turn-helix domain-containing protein n=1 Tax=uncultured Aquimarina sp. TaxID=575652 RepID=UPI0026369748|nr:helix-turn-helix domain-containing protein [uncultured Aquimarina sp.]
MNFTFFDILIILGLALSFFLVVLIFFSKSFRKDVHYYFATAIISINFFLIITQFESFVPSNGILELISWEFLFPFAFMMFSLKAIRHPLNSNRKIWFLSIPFILFSSFQCIDFFFDFDVYDWLVGYDENKLIYIIEAKTIFFLLFSIALIGFSYFKIKNANTLYKAERKWLKLNSLFLSFFLLIWILSGVIDTIYDFPVWEYLLVVLAIFLMIITFFGVHHLNISEQRKQISKLVVKGSIQNHKETIAELELENLTTLSLSKTNKKIELLISLMKQENYYLDSNLTRTAVAKKLDISEGYLSELLKTNLHTNFNDFVNEYRVNHSIKMFQNKKFDIFTIEAIGFEAGFKSKSVFYNSFKKVKKKSPGIYRKELKMS